MPDADPTLQVVAGVLPDRRALVFVVGALEPSLAALLTANGHAIVVAGVAPGPTVRTVALDAANITHLADTLPGLPAMLRLGLSADLILINGMWDHMQPADREKTFRKLVAMLRSGGILVSVVQTPPMRDQLKMMGRVHGMLPIDIPALGAKRAAGTLLLGLRLPDDGTGALPLLRRIILSDQKSSTYKLALIRALCRAAQGSGGMACDDGDDHVSLPLGLLALNWICLYLPLTAANLPQAPQNRTGAEGLAFAGRAWSTIADSPALRQNLRVGREFSGKEASAIRSALRDAARLIRDMPAKHIRFPGGAPVLEIAPGDGYPKTARMTLDQAALASFGTVSIPRYVWAALQKMALWIEPVLAAEWVRQMHGFAAGQGRMLDSSAVTAAMQWSNPERTTGVPRNLALARIGSGQPVHCVWSGRRLTEQNLDIDHCIPWSAWPCNDLWNLLPCDRRINQNQKRERLPSLATLLRSMDSMVSWWCQSYRAADSAHLRRRFDTEAYASLPNLGRPAKPCDLEDVSAALRILQVRLAHDQGIPEWTIRTATR